MKKRILLAAAFVGLVTLAGCGGSDGNQTVVATNDATATISASNGTQAVTPVLSKDFAFTSGIAAFGTTGSTVVTLRPRTTATLPDNRVPSENPEFTVTSGGGTATGLVQFGSCTFIVQSSTISTIPVGASIRFDPCGITYDVDNKPVNTTFVASTTLTLGTTTSQGVNITVTLSATGAVTVNGAPTGASSNVAAVTGS